MTRLSLDTRRKIETPEGVDFVLELAGPVPRSTAALIDLMLRAVIWLTFGTFVALAGDAAGGLMLLMGFIVEWVYPVYFEMYHHGRTPGKMVVGLQVLHDDGTSVTWTGSVLRNVLRFADLLPFLWVAGLASMAWTRDFQRLGDLAANTVVVHRVAPTMTHRELPDVQARPSPRILTAAEKLAIVNFARRSTTWNPERSEELAEILTPLVGTKTPQKAVEDLQGIASGIAGRS